MKINVRSTAGAISGVAGVVLLSRMLGFTRELVIADRFGTSSSYDVYLLAIMLSALVYGVYNFALYYLLVPFLSKRLVEEGDGNESDFLWRTASSIALFSLFISATLALLAPYLLKPWLSELSVSQQSAAVYYARVTACVVLFGAGEALFRAYLNVKKIYAYPALGYVVFNIIAILTIVLFAEAYSIGAIAYGWVFGLAAQNILLLIFATKFASGIRSHRFLKRDDIRFLTVTGLWLIAIESCRGAYFLIDRYFAIDFGNGVISALNYSQVVVQLPESIVGFAIGAVVFPVMSNYAACKNDSGFAKVYEKTVTAAWLLAVPMAAFMFVNARPMIEILFMRGQFDSQSVELTSTIMQPHLFTALALFVIGVSLRACYSRNWVRPVLVATLSILTLKIISTVAFSHWFGYVGISAATSVTQLSYAALLMSLVAYRIPEVNGRLLVGNLICGLMAGLLAGVAGFYTLSYMMAGQVDVSKFDTIISMLTSGIVILIVYGLAGWLLRLNRYIFLITNKDK